MLRKIEKLLFKKAVFEFCIIKLTKSKLLKYTFLESPFFSPGFVLAPTFAK